MHFDLFYLLPRAIQYGFAIATFVLLVRLWRMTRQAGFAILAGLLAFTYLQILMLPYLLVSLGSSLMSNAYWYIAAVSAGLTAYAWWRIYAWFRDAYARGQQAGS